MQDGALQLTKTLSNETQELVKLDLSSCGITSEYFSMRNTGICLINGILELNLGGNPIMQEVFFPPKEQKTVLLIFLGCIFCAAYICTRLSVYIWYS